MKEYEVDTQLSVGIKILTEADLGRKSSSNQTHIGLFDNTANYNLKTFNSAVAQLVVGNKVFERMTFLDAIEVPEGGFRSPKIRAGKQNELEESKSLVKEIRRIASNGVWFLLWFTLKPPEMVFFLIEKNSKQYVEIEKILGFMPNRRSISSSDPQFYKLKDYLETKLTMLNASYLEEIETSSLLDESPTGRRSDLAEAKRRAEETGRKGEILLNEFFEKQKNREDIKDFIWENKYYETGSPYDFKILKNNKEICYCDAKSTLYCFERPIILSSNEISFINKHINNYHIYRIYNLRDNARMRVCRALGNFSGRFSEPFKYLQKFSHNLEVSISNCKISLNPLREDIDFSDELNLVE